MHSEQQEAEYGRNPYRDEPVTAPPESLGRVPQALIAIVIALAAIYLAS